MKINILLSTYNGEAFLSTLLDSLIQQDWESYTIFIRDDCSTDRSREILEEYALKSSRIVLFPYDGIRMYYPDCFWFLLRNSDPADYYAFCDQDDLWHPGKLSHIANKLFHEYKNGISQAAVLLAHGYYLCDKDLNIIRKDRFPDLSVLKARELIFYSPIPGFSMVINEPMRELTLSQNPEGKNAPHDLWQLWNAVHFGTVLYDDKCLVKYRRHSAAATPTGNRLLGMATAFVKKELIGDAYVNLCEAGNYFAVINKDRLSKEEYYEWKHLSFREKTVFGYFRRIFYPKRLRPNVFGEIALRLLFATGR